MLVQQKFFHPHWFHYHSIVWLVEDELSNDVYVIHHPLWNPRLSILDTEVRSSLAANSTFPKIPIDLDWKKLRIYFLFRLFFQIIFFVQINCEFRFFCSDKILSGKLIFTLDEKGKGCESARKDWWKWIVCTVIHSSLNHTSLSESCSSYLTFRQRIDSSLQEFFVKKVKKWRLKRKKNK